MNEYMNVLMNGFAFEKCSNPSWISMVGVLLSKACCCVTAGTALGDPIEIGALRGVLGQDSFAGFKSCSPSVAVAFLPPSLTPSYFFVSSCM